MTQNISKNAEIRGSTEVWHAYKQHRGGSTQATILPWAIILTNAHRAVVSIIA